MALILGGGSSRRRTVVRTHMAPARLVWEAAPRTVDRSPPYFQPQPGLVGGKNDGAVGG
jgi:hypothetical protein